jgi:glycosyltransferase involved in cell wall biosynthesis
VALVKITGLYVVVPALNEASTIEKVVVEALDVAEKVLVVDDGSRDLTAALAKAAGALVVTHETPLGYDPAIAAGINSAFAQGAKAVITCDADGQHLLKDVFRVANLLVEEQLDFCGGIRDRYNRPIEALAGVLAMRLWGTSDPFCGLKCYSSSFYKQTGPFPADLNIGTLPFVWIRNRRMKFRFLPISTKKRIDQPRFGPLLRSNLRLGKALAKSLWAQFNSSRRS